MKRFEATMLRGMGGDRIEFTESTAPDWLTGAKTVKGSTMDCRWFWEDHILTLGVGQSEDSNFRRITRIA